MLESPRWHYMDMRQLSGTFLDGRHLMDAHHPAGWLALQMINIYLNMHQQHANIINRSAKQAGADLSYGTSWSWG